VYFDDYKRMRARRERDGTLRNTNGLLPEKITVYQDGKKSEGGVQSFSQFFERRELLGQGSFGQVFLGTLQTDNSTVVLKRAREGIVGGEFLLEKELELNEFAMENCPDAVSNFLGCVEVGEEEEGQVYDGVLTSGLWLVWQFQSDKTLGSIFAKESKDGYQSLGEAFKTDNNAIAVTQAAAKSLLSGLSSLHAAGMVHRDVKPENLLVVEGDLKFIDLGASAECLSKGINFEAGEGPHDPLFCLPDDEETQLLPASSEKPDPSNLATLWSQYLIDRFDMYAAGVTILQVAAPGLREQDRLANFKKELYEGANGDVRLVKDAVDAPGLDESGWDLVASLMSVQRSQRPSAADALKHPFVS